MLINAQTTNVCRRGEAAGRQMARRCVGLLRWTGSQDQVMILRWCEQLTATDMNTP